MSEDHVLCTEFDCFQKFKSLFDDFFQGRLHANLIPFLFNQAISYRVCVIFFYKFLNRLFENTACGIVSDFNIK